MNRLIFTLFLGNVKRNEDKTTQFKTTALCATGAVLEAMESDSKDSHPNRLKAAMVAVQMSKKCPPGSSTDLWLPENSHSMDAFMLCI